MTHRVSDLRPIARPESIALAAAESARMTDLLRDLSPQEWARPTDCPAWDVRAVGGHVLGMLDTFASLRMFAKNMRAAGKAAGDGVFIDALTALQVEANASLSTTELVRRMDVVGPRQARWRGRRRLMRKIPMKQPLNDGAVETWRLAFLVDIILTRDTWMHRVDVARATGRELELSTDHDGRIVADAVIEWARRHGRPFTLHLSGPAGGTFVQGDDGDVLRFDAIEFCRILSGRVVGVTAFDQEVPF